MFLGLDVGTGSAKALLLDGDGVTVAESSATYRPLNPQPDWSEIDVETWWRAIIACCQRLPRAERGRVRGIGVTGQMHGVVLSTADGRAVRPAILWPDSRASSVLSRYPADSLERVGNTLSPGMAGPLLVWLRENEPGAVRAARWALQPKDWLRLRLTGQAFAEPSDASGTLLTDRRGLWDTDLCAMLELDAALLAPVVDSAGPAGALGASAAECLGLPAGIPVAAGGGDTPVAALGSGLLEDGAAQLSTGSGAQILVMRSGLPPVSPRLNCYRTVSSGALPRWYLMAAMQNAGVALEWVRTILRLDWPAAYGLAFEQGAAADGELLFLPYVSGERTPWMNPRLRGGWVGLNPGTDAGQMMRAAFVGVAFSIRAGLDALKAHGVVFDSLNLAGGGSVHPAWQQLLMDVLQLPLAAVQCTNASARGAALLGGMAEGYWQESDLTALAPPAQSLGVPQSRVYEAPYARFWDLSGRLATWFGH